MPNDFLTDKEETQSNRDVVMQTDDKNTMNMCVTRKF